MYKVGIAAKARQLFFHRMKLILELTLQPEIENNNKKNSHQMNLLGLL